MSAGAIKAGAAFVEVSANDSKAQRVLRQFEAKFRAFGNGMKQVGATMTAAMAGAAVPAAFGVKSFATLEQSMANLRAAANPTAQEFDQITAAVDRISKSAGKGPADVANAMGELLKAGMSLDQVLGGATESAVKFAKVGTMDVAAAATVMNDALNVFGKQGLTAAQAVDTISRAADASSVSIEQVAQAFSMSSAVFGQAGMSIEDLSAAIAVLGNAGVKGSDAGTSLKTMLLRLQTGAESAGKVMDELGIKVRDANGNMLPMRGIVAELERKLGGLNAVAKDQALLDLFGSDAIRAGAILLQSGAKGFDAFTGKMNESLSVGAKFAQVTDTLEGKFAASTASVERAGAAVGQALSPALAALGLKVTDVAGRVAAWAQANPELVRTIGTAGVALAGLSISVVGIGVVMSNAAVAIKGFGAAMAFVAANPLVAGLTVLAAAVGAVAIAARAGASGAVELADALEGTRKKGDELRQLDDYRLQRLAQLAKQESLNSDEMREAAPLIATLSKQYGDLGLSLDTTTKKLVGFASAQQKVRKAMRAAAEAEVKAEIAEVEANQARFARQVQVNSPEGAQVMALAARKRALEARLKALTAGDTDSVTGQSTSDADKLKATIAVGSAGRSTRTSDAAGLFPSAGAKEAAKDAADELAKIEADHAKRRMDEYDREIAEARETAAEKLKLIDQLTKGAQSQQAVADLIVKRKQAELDAEAEILRIQQAKAKAQEQARTDAALQAKEIEKQYSDAIGNRQRSAKIEADIYRQRETERVKALKLSPDAEARALGQVGKVADSIGNAPAREAADIIGGLKEQAARQAAEARGDRAAIAKMDAERFKTDQLKGITDAGLMGTQWKQAAALIDQIAKGMAGAADAVKVESRGTFNAAAIQGLQGGGIQEQIRDGVKAIAQNTKPLRHSLPGMVRFV
jgi:TP901 family phage tail tape measure protein